MDEKFAILRRGPNYNSTMAIGYNTLKQAADDGAVVLAYGYVSKRFLSLFQAPPQKCRSMSMREAENTNIATRQFINKTLNFVGVGLSLYFIASIYEFFSKDTVIKYQVKCPYCRKRISEKVTHPSRSFLSSSSSWHLSSILLLCLIDF